MKASVVSVWLGTLLITASAVADPRRFLSVGLHFAASMETRDVPLGLGAGASLSYHAQRSQDGLSGWGLGAVARGSFTTPPDADGSRGTFALAGQLSWLCLGLELGLAARTPQGPSPASLGLHVGPYLSMGFAYLAPTLYIPLSSDEGTQLTWVVGLTLPRVVNRPRWNDWYDRNLH